jgi:hypothetical protein
VKVVVADTSYWVALNDAPNPNGVNQVNVAGHIAPSRGGYWTNDKRPPNCAQSVQLYFRDGVLLYTQQ